MVPAGLDSGVRQLQLCAPGLVHGYSGKPTSWGVFKFSRQDWATIALTTGPYSPLKEEVNLARNIRVHTDGLYPEQRFFRTCLAWKGLLGFRTLMQEGHP